MKEKAILFAAAAMFAFGLYKSHMHDEKHTQLEEMPCSASIHEAEYRIKILSLKMSSLDSAINAANISLENYRGMIAQAKEKFHELEDIKEVQTFLDHKQMKRIIKRAKEKTDEN